MKEFFDFLLFRSKDPIERIDRMMAILAWICLAGFVLLGALMITLSFYL